MAAIDFETERVQLCIDAVDSAHQSDLHALEDALQEVGEVEVSQQKADSSQPSRRDTSTISVPQPSRPTRCGADPRSCSSAVR